MRALVMENSLRLTELDRPVATEDEALIKVQYAGICDTDLEIVKGYMDFEGILGHEFVGKVEYCIDEAWLGKRVVADINLSCDTCKWCLKGLSNHCPNRTVLGIAGRSGVFADYVAIPVKNLIEVPAPIEDKDAIFIEPLAASLEILEQVQIKPSERVAIIGDGKLAILIAQILKLTGCASIVIGKHPEKLALFQQLGIATSLHNNLAKKSFPVVVEASGSPNGLELALQLVEPRGNVVVKSTYNENANLNISNLVVNEITLLGSRCGPYPAAIRLLVQKLITIEPLISKIFPLSQAIDAFEHAKRENVFKVIMEMN